MFRNKGALQMGCFLGRHLHCLLPLNIRGPVREGEGDDRFVLPEKHFITGFLKASPLCPTVCLCVVCLPPRLLRSHSLPFCAAWRMPNHSKCVTRLRAVTAARVRNPCLP